MRWNVIPFRITLKVESDCQEIVKKPKELARLTDLPPEMQFVKNVSIAPDFTPEQRSD